MKTPSSDLFELIKSLTKSEKRYISLQASSENADYILLWKALLEQKTYDENKLKQEHPKADFIKNFAMSKQYLFGFILQALDRYRQQSEADKLIKNGHLAKILLSKGFEKKASTLLKKSLKKAEEAELYIEQIFLLEVKKKFPQTDFSATKEIVQQCLQKLENINEYWELNQAIHKKSKELKNSPDTIKEENLYRLFNNPKLLNPSFALTIRSKVYYYDTRVIYFTAKGQLESAFTSNQAFLKLLEDNPQQLRLMPERYLSVLSQLLDHSLALEKYDAFELALNKWQKLRSQRAFKKVKNVDVRIFKKSILSQINRHLKPKNYAQTIKLTEELKEGTVRYAKKIEKSDLYILQYHIAYLHFLNKKFESALHWSNLILEQEDKDGIHFFAAVLNVASHTELNDNSAASALVNKTKHKLQNTQKQVDKEMSLSAFLEKYLALASFHERQDLITEYKFEAFHDFT